MQDRIARQRCGWGGESPCPFLICWECEFSCLRRPDTLYARKIREMIVSGTISADSIRCSDGKKQFEL